MTSAGYWFVNTVAVTPYLRTGSYGPEWGPSQVVNCWVEDGNTLIRDSAGAEVVSSSKVYAPLSLAQLFTVGSKVTTPSRASIVLSLERYDSGSLGLGDHCVANLK